MFTVRPLPKRGWVTYLGGGYPFLVTPSLTALQPPGLEYNGLFNPPFLILLLVMYGLSFMN